MGAQAPVSFTSPQGVRAYQVGVVTGAGPGELVIRTYDAAVVACRRGDGERAARAVVELINALNFEHGDVAHGLFRLYRYCLELIKQSRYDEPARILFDLRQTWAEAMAQHYG